MRSRRYLSAWLVVAGGLLVASCGDDDATSPPISSVVGQYAAVTFRTTDAGTVTDQLAQGATIAINLTANGTTTGRLFVPGGGEMPGTDLEADLAGTWALTNDTVRFSQNADTFVRDMAFAVGTNDLVGSATFDGVLIEVVLRK